MPPAWNCSHRWVQRYKKVLPHPTGPLIFDLLGTEEQQSPRNCGLALYLDISVYAIESGKIQALMVVLSFAVTLWGGQCTFGLILHPRKLRLRMIKSVYNAPQSLALCLEYSHQHIVCSSLCLERWGGLWFRRASLVTSWKDRWVTQETSLWQ